MNLFPFDEHVQTLLEYSLPAVCILAIAAPWLLKARLPRIGTISNGILAAAAVLAFLSSTSLHWQHRSYFNAHVFFHYYMGAKYSSEISYTGLYDAAWIAQYEQSLPEAPRVLRNLENGLIEKPDRVLRRRTQIEERFSPDRWSDFCGDVAFFRRTMDGKSWSLLFIDKGYNATPVWTMIGGFLANAVPTRNLWGMRALIWLDVVLMAGAVLCVGWAFDLRAMLLLIVFLFTGYYASHPHMRGAFLRTDWIAALIVSVCLLERGKPRGAGVLAGYAALSRVFPVLFVFGIGAKAGAGLIRSRKIEPGHRAVLTGFLGVLLVASLLTLLSPGLAQWRAFGAKIFDHDPLLGIGFKYLFLRADRLAAEEVQLLDVRFDELRIYWWILQALIVSGCGFLVLKLRDHEAMAMGFCLLFFLLTPAYYYYIALALPLLFFAGRSESLAGTGGLVLLFAILLVTRWVTRIHPQDPLQLSFKLSALIALIVAYMVFFSFLLSRRGSPDLAGSPKPV